MSITDLIDDDAPLWDDEADPTMTFYEYQEAAMQTAVYPGHLIYPIMELNGEAGECAEKLKKLLRDDQLPLDGGDPLLDLNLEQRVELAKELGDVLWALTAAATDLGFDLDEIADMNIEKLSSRQQRSVIHGSGDNR